LRERGHRTMTRMRANRTLSLIAVVVALCWCGTARSDTIVFNNGIKLKAEILEETTRGVRIKLPNGKIEFHKRSEIKRIERDLPPLYAKAEEHLKKGELEAAIVSFKQAAKEGVNAYFSERAMVRLQQCNIAAGRYDEAVRAYVSLLRQNPDTINYGNFPVPRRGDEKNEAAMRFLNMAITAEKNAFVAGMMKGLLACILATEKRLDEAKKLAGELLMASDSRVVQFAKLLYGQLAYEEGNYHDAIDILRKNLRTLPMELHPVAYYYLGLAYKGQGDALRSDIYLLRTAFMMPNFHEQVAAEGIYLVARRREAEKKWEDALKLYRELVENFPGSAHLADAKKSIAMMEQNPE